MKKASHSLILGLTLMTTSAAIGSSQPIVPLHYHGAVFNPNGKFAIGANVSLYRIGEPHSFINALRVVTGSNGVFDFQVTKPLATEFDVLRVDGAAGVAVQPVSLATSRVILHPSTSIQIALQNEQGAAASGVEIYPTYLQEHNGGVAQWNEAIPAGWSAKTNNKGIAVLSGIPVNYSVGIGINNDRYVQPHAMLLSTSMSVHTVHTIKLKTAGFVTGTARFRQSGKPAAGIPITAFATGDSFGSRSGVTDKLGHYHIGGLTAGHYEVEIFPTTASSDRWIAAAQPADISAGVLTQAPDLSVVRGAVITGKVTDAKNSRPIPNVIAYAVDPAHPDDVHSLFAALTDDKGSYHLHVAPGHVKVQLFGNTISSNDLRPAETDVTEGETKALNFQIVSIGPWPIRGTVLDALDKPAAGAVIQARKDNPPNQIEVRGDSLGQFHFPAPGLTPEYSLIARAGDSATTSPVRIMNGEALTLHLVPGLFCALHGHVTTEHEKPVAKASVQLIRWVNGSGERIEKATTNSDGTFRFASNFAKAQYSVLVKAVGYGNVYSNNIEAIPGGDSDFRVSLNKIGSFVSGVVVDRHGHPIAGANVVADRMDNVHAITDRNGRFRLAGMPTKTNNDIVVTALGGRQGYYGIYSGRSDARIYLFSPAESAAAAREISTNLASDPNLHGNGIDAGTLLSKAERKAAASGKNILLVFGASWCGPCYVVNRFLEKPKVRTILTEHFVTLHLDIFEENNKHWENPGGVNLYKRYGGISSVPFWVILRPTGSKIGDSLINGENQALSFEPSIIEHFLSVVKLAAPGMSASEVSRLQNLLKHMWDN